MRFPVPLILGSLLIVISGASAQETAPLSLLDAQKLAFQNHGNVAAARASLIGAAQRVTGAKAGRAPQLSGTLGTDYQNGRLLSAPLVQNGVTSTLTTGIAVSQNIFDSGKTTQSVRQARANAGALLGNFGSARNSLASEVATRFFEQLRQSRLVAQRQNQLEVARSQLNQIQARIDVGESPRSDLSGARVTLSQAQFDLTTARNDLRNAATNLRNALGLERGAPLELAYETPRDFSVDLEIPAAQQLALSRRPELLTFRQQILANQALLQSARIDARPNLAASAGYNLDPREVGNRRFNLGATVSIPFLDGGGRKSLVRAAQNDVRASQIQLAQAQRDAETEVEVALTNLAGQIERLQNARELVRDAQENLDTATGRYAAGVGIALDVTLASSQLFQAQTSLVGAEFDYQLGRSEIDRATGRFAFENEVAPDVNASVEALR